MYGVGVNLQLGDTEGMIEKQSDPVDTDTGGHRSVPITGAEFSGLDLEKIACRSSCE